MRRAISSIAALGDTGLRVGGLVAAVLGTGLAWLLVGG
jgi:uncharacterized protein YjeT (DUF2065 family)